MISKKVDKKLYEELDSFDDEVIKEGVGEDQKIELITELNDFNKWLINSKIIKEEFDIQNIRIEPFSDEDWTMKVYDFEEKKIVSFNPYIIKKCDFEYLKMVLLHEYFHLIVQKVPNKLDATKIKDTFGSDFMSLIDIEADYYVALYLKQEKQISINDYWKLYFNGANVFLDDWIRTKKFERFLGSLLSVNKMFSECFDEISFDLFLPTIASIYTEETIMVLVVREKHIAFQELFAEYDDFKDIRDLYKNPKNFEFIQYYDAIIKFTNKALALKIN